MKGLIAAAGLSARLQDLGDRQNKTLLDLGGETLLGNILSQFQRAGIDDIYVVVGFDALAVRTHCHNAPAASSILSLSTTESLAAFG